MWILAIDSSFITFVVIVLISAVANWVQNRRQLSQPSESEDWTPDPDEPPTLERRPEPQEPPPALERWERDLRRILTGESEAAGPAPEKPRSAPHPSSAQSPVRPAVPSRPSLPPQASPKSVGPAMKRIEQQARQLQEAVASRTRKMTRAGTPAPAMEVHRVAGRSQEARATVKTSTTVRNLRSGAGTRQAVIAAVILAPLRDDPFVRPVSG